MFISGGFIVVANHHHCQDLRDIKNLQTCCQYLKNPVVTKSILIIVILTNPLTFSIIYFVTLVKEGTLNPIDLDSLKKQYLIVLSPFPQRAPPNK